MNLQEKLLEELKSDCKQLNYILAKAYDAVVVQEISDYPIYIVHQHEVSVGIPLIDREKMDCLWNFNISSLEEFVTKQIIQEERIANFKEVFKHPSDYFCLFVLSESGAQFVFVPRTMG